MTDTLPQEHPGTRDKAAAPAAAYALRALTETANHAGPPARAALLALAVLADRALYSDSGYSDHLTADAAQITGLTPDAAAAAVTELLQLGLLSDCGGEGQTRAVRIPQAAFDWANGDSPVVY